MALQPGDPCPQCAAGKGKIRKTEAVRVTVPETYDSPRGAGERTGTWYRCDRNPPHEGEVSFEPPKPSYEI